MLSSSILATTTTELEIHPLLILPFVLLLLSIAVMPLVNNKWWEKYYPYVSIGWGAVVLLYYLFVFKAPGPLLHVAAEYASFIALIGSLFVVSGGIHISPKGQSTPLMNCAFLAVGGILSNVIGTTGASMLLIRPWIRMNKRRVTSFHIVFFIFIISNISGALTPIGDPPLFLGFLRGVPFWWTLEHCWPGWLAGMVITISTFYFFDVRNYRRAHLHLTDDLSDEPDNPFWKVSGLPNLGFLLMILIAVFIESPYFFREILMILAAVGSYLTTPEMVHKSNNFNFHTGGLLVVCRDIPDNVACAQLFGRSCGVFRNRHSDEVFLVYRASLRCFGQRSDLFDFSGDSNGAFWRGHFIQGGCNAICVGT